MQCLLREWRTLMNLLCCGKDRGKDESHLRCWMNAKWEGNFVFILVDFTVERKWQKTCLIRANKTQNKLKLKRKKGAEEFTSVEELHIFSMLVGAFIFKGCWARPSITASSSFVIFLSSFPPYANVVVLVAVMSFRINDLPITINCFGQINVW